MYRYLVALAISLLFSLGVKGTDNDTLIVGYTSAPPFLVTETGDVEGINIWLWEKTAADLSIPFKLQKMSFTDMLEAISKGEIDLSINPLTMTSERSQQMAFTSPFYVSNSTVITKTKSRWDTVKNILKTFFSLEFLSGMFLLFLIIGFFGWLTWIFERKKNPEQFRPGYEGIWDGLWWSTVTMTTVGYGNKVPKSVGGKIIALLWMLIAIMFISGLTASIASTILSVRNLSSAITIDDLRDSNIGTRASTTTVAFLKTRFFDSVSEYESIEDGFDAIADGDIDGFVYDEPILRYRLLERDKEDLQIRPIKFNLQLYAFALSKDRRDLVPKISERILHYTSSMEWSVLLSQYELEVL